MSWLKKLTSGLSKTSARVTSSLSSLLGRSSIDAASIEEVEDALISADLGTAAAARLAERVRRHKFDGEVTAQALAGALADGGLLIVSTPNRTPLSRLAMITIAEGTGRIPRGTHDWNKFLTPDELTAHLAAAGLTVVDRQGLGFSPATGFSLSDDVSLDYFLTAVRG